MIKAFIKFQFLDRKKIVQLHARNNENKTNKTFPVVICFLFIKRQLKTIKDCFVCMGLIGWI